MEKEDHIEEATVIGMDESGPILGRIPDSEIKKPPRIHHLNKPLREALAVFLTENYEEFVESFRAIKDPKDKATIYLQAAKYVVPALQSVSITDKTEVNRTIEERLKFLENS